MEFELLENDIKIRKLMTNIRRNKTGKIYNNYYNNCLTETNIYLLEGNRTIVFYYKDNDLFRGHFYSDDKEELIKLLKELPAKCIIDYLTKDSKDEALDILTKSNMKLMYEMHRMTSANLSEEEKLAIEEKKKIFEPLYRAENVFAATLDDLDAIYKKLYEIFDERESHLPDMNELTYLINNKWVTVFKEYGEIKGFEMVKIEQRKIYGYQMWNSSGPDGYYSLMTKMESLCEEYLNKIGLSKKDIKPGYSWINVKNKTNKRLLEYWGERFDGLYDFVFEKCVDEF